MKMAIGVYRVSRGGAGEFFQMVKSICLLRQRAAVLRRQGFEVISLGEGADLADRWAQLAREEGADLLWLCFRSSGRPFRQSLLGDPAALDKLTFYADGILGPNLPPTRGQREVMKALGIHYLSPEEAGQALLPAVPAQPQPDPVG